MHDAVSNLSKRDLGPSFKDVLHSFIALEAAHGYQNPNRGIAVSGRPDILTKWIACGRWRAKDPVISNPDVFGKKWWEWWTSLQPPWRKIRSKRPDTMSTYGDSWDTLLYPGQNGVLSIVATLYWWGIAVNGDGVPGPAYDSWSVAVADVKWILEGMLKHMDGADE